MGRICKTSVIAMLPLAPTDPWAEGSELSEKGRRLQGTAQPWDHCGGSRVPGDGNHQPCPGHPLGTVHSRGWAAPGRAVTQSHNTTAHPKNGGGCVPTAETQAAARGQE